MVRGLLHVAISVTDIRRTLDFYCGILGFTHLFDINDEQGKPKTFYTLVKEGQYFEIFLSRMSLCKKAAKYLGLRFQLEINGQKLVQ